MKGNERQEAIWNDYDVFGSGQMKFFKQIEGNFLEGDKIAIDSIGESNKWLYCPMVCRNFSCSALERERRLNCISLALITN